MSIVIISIIIVIRLNKREDKLTFLNIGGISGACGGATGAEDVEATSTSTTSSSLEGKVLFLRAFSTAAGLQSAF